MLRSVCVIKSIYIYIYRLCKFRVIEEDSYKVHERFMNEGSIFNRQSCHPEPPDHFCGNFKWGGFEIIFEVRWVRTAAVRLADIIIFEIGLLVFSSFGGLLVPFSYRDNFAFLFLKQPLQP